MRYFLGIRPPNRLGEAVEHFRRRYNWRGIEPHITVKAPCGLDDKEEWLANIRQLCQGVAALPIQISGVGTFGSAVLYLRVTSSALHRLHQRILEELYISDADQIACYEGGGYIPHLTLLYTSSIATDLVSTATTEAKSYFSGAVSFQATDLLVYRKTEQSTYQIVESIPLQSSPLLSTLL